MPCSHDFYSFVSSTLLLHNSTFSFKTITSPAVNCGPNFLSFKYCNKAAERDSTLRSYQHTNDPRTLDKFKSLRKQCNRIAVDDKRTYLSSEINKYRYSDPLKMWRVLNIFFNNHNQLPSFMTISNEKVTDAEVIAYSFNNYFCSVISKLLCDTYGFIPFVSSIEPILNITSTSDCFCFVDCDSFSVFTYFNSFKKSRLDRNFISHNIFNLHPTFFSSVICYFINTCLQDSTFPSFLKTSEVIPIFKKGNPHDMCNYRPISLLPTLSRVFEKVIAAQIETYMSKNNLLSSNKFGYDKGNSTESALNMLLYHIYKNIERN